MNQGAKIDTECVVTGEHITSEEEAMPVQLKRIGQGNITTTSKKHVASEHAPSQIRKSYHVEGVADKTLTIVVNSYNTILYCTGEKDHYWSALDMDDKTIEYLEAIVSAVLN